MVWMTMMGFLTLTRGQLTELLTTGNCSIAPVACYLNTPYPVALRPGLNCTFNFQCLSNNCSSTNRCGTSPFGGNCLALTDCVTSNCTNTICTFRVVPLQRGCLYDQECIGFPTNLCDPVSKTCRVSTGNECTSTADCVSGDDCETVLCAPDQPCPNLQYCVNITATAGSRFL